jgi:hypothetical protein
MKKVFFHHILKNPNQRVDQSGDIRFDWRMKRENIPLKDA